MSDSLLHHNTFGIPATCNQFVEYDSVEELQNQLVPLLQNGERWMHVGSGSNLLFVCKHYDGTVLHSRIRGIEVSDEDDDEILLRVGAGEEWDPFVQYCTERGWYGLENLSLIPGEVGASAVQNVGAYGVEAGERIEAVEGYVIGNSQSVSADETPILSATVIDHADCHYAYRSSVFKHELKDRFIVTHVWYRLSKHFTPVMSHKAISVQLESQGIDPQHCTAGDIREAVIQIRKSKLPDPKEIGSAGSFFMNPVVPQEIADRLLLQYPAMPHYPAPLPSENAEVQEQGVKIPAGWLIDQCGWRGRSVGPAAVHPQQALVLTNLGGATGQDIQNLAFTIQADVREKFGIDIHPEVLFIH